MKIFLSSIFLVLVLSQNAYANWFDDYSSTVKTSPSYFETQKRGYAYGGSISYRTGAGDKEPIIGFSAPKIEAGCGGIDVAFGGLSFLNPEYLVKAFQNIMQAAPAFAFKLALTNLCSQCDAAMTSLEGLANAVNNFAMDECKAAQALTNFGGDLVAETGAFDAFQGIEDNPLNSFAKSISDTADDFATSINDLLNYQYCGGLGEHKDGNYFGMNPTQCQAVLQPIGSVWYKAIQKISKENDQTYKKLVEVASAIFGDIYITPPNQKSGSGNDDRISIGEILFISPCGTATEQDIIDVLLDTIDVNGNKSKKPIAYREYIKKDDGIAGEYFKPKVPDACGMSYDHLPDEWYIGIKAQNAIDNIVDIMTNRNGVGTLDTDTIKMINQSSYPVYQEINNLAYRYAETGTGVEDVEKKYLGEVLALGHIDYILSHFVEKLSAIINDAMPAIEKSAELAAKKQDMKDALKKMQARMAAFKSAIYKRTSERIKNRDKAMKKWHEFYEVKNLYVNLIKRRNLLGSYRGL